VRGVAGTSRGFALLSRMTSPVSGILPPVARILLALMDLAKGPLRRVILRFMFARTLRIKWTANAAGRGQVFPRRQGLWFHRARPGR
jgi:hypothetical protein